MIQLKNKFRIIAGEDQLIDKEEFFKGLDISNQQLSDRLFNIFDKDNNGTIDYDEFISTIEEITTGTKNEKIRFAFNLHDLDGSGFIDKNELTFLISQSFIENNLDYDEFQLNLLVEEFFIKADKDNSGNIDFEEFLGIATDFPDFIDGFAVSPIRWLASNNGLKKSFSKKIKIKNKVKKQVQVQDIGLLQSILIPKMISYYNILLNRKKNRSIVHLISSKLLPSETLEIKLQIPEKIKFTPGDYLYLNSREISYLEWHPFNIIRQTSNDEIVLHIKASDSWTKKIYKMVINSFKNQTQIDFDFRIDGPYGSSSKKILNAEHAILIGGGHGISKIASILQDIAMKIRNNSQEVFLKKINLFWLIEDEAYFEWFTKFLDEIESEEKINIFNFNIYFVDKAPHEIPGKMMYMSTDLENTTTDVTLINNIWGKSKFGLPNWSEELNQILEETSNLKSEIFYSGPLKYRKTIESIAKEENITFHKKAF